MTVTFYACNAFNTTDRGSVIVDFTGVCPLSHVTWAVLYNEIGEIYQLRALFISGKIYDPMGVVKNFEVYR